jgi:hypothetical protein
MSKPRSRNLRSKEPTTKHFNNIDELKEAIRDNPGNLEFVPEPDAESQEAPWYFDMQHLFDFDDEVLDQKEVIASEKPGFF